MEIKVTDCVFDRGNRCSALTGMECKNCSFKKTKEQLDEGRRVAAERIRSLPVFSRMYIKDKYYNQ